MSSLSERIAATTSCAVVGCDRHRAPDAVVCREDLVELWANRLVRQDDGTYRRRPVFVARDLTYSRAAL